MPIALYLCLICSLLTLASLGTHQSHDTHQSNNIFNHRGNLRSSWNGTKLQLPPDINATTPPPDLSSSSGTSYTVYQSRDVGRSDVSGVPTGHASYHNNADNYSLPSISFSSNETVLDNTYNHSTSSSKSKRFSPHYSTRFPFRSSTFNTSTRSSTSTQYNNNRYVSKRKNDINKIRIFILFSSFLLFVASVTVVHVLRWLSNLNRIRSRTNLSDELVSRLGLYMFMNGRFTERDATLLRIAGTDRDFNAEDYEMLQALDDMGAARQESEGCSENEIDRLPLHLLSEEEILHHSRRKCSICLAFYELGDEIRTVPCLHQFHKDCIDPWLRSKSNCPICKFDING